MHFCEVYMKDFFNSPKLVPIILTVISIATGSIMFLPGSKFAKTGLDKTGNPNNIVINVIFILSTALVFIYIVKNVQNKIEEYRFNKRSHALLGKIMNELSHENKIVNTNKDNSESD